METLCRPVLQSFLDTTTAFDDSQYIVIGTPIDLTASYRSGTRFAPDAMRWVSQYMETFSIRNGLDLDDISLGDAGNVTGLEGVMASLKRIEARATFSRTCV